jgi:hypothetical protein
LINLTKITNIPIKFDYLPICKLHCFVIVNFSPTQVESLIFFFFLILNVDQRQLTLRIHLTIAKSVNGKPGKTKCVEQCQFVCNLNYPKHASGINAKFTETCLSVNYSPKFSIRLINLMKIPSQFIIKKLFFLIGEMIFGYLS